MRVHEYQAKALFQRYGIGVPPARTASSVDEAVAAAHELGGDAWVLKAQIHAGARGKAGGVQTARGEDELRAIVRRWLGTRLVTEQTGPEGLPVNTILVESPVSIESELYVALLVDRSAARVSVMASAAGGMEVEHAAQSDQSLVKIAVDPIVGLQPYQCRKISYALSMPQAVVNPFAALLQNLYRMALDCDLGLLEINPLVVTTDRTLVALDAKVQIDDNALYRQRELAGWDDPTQEDERERKARSFQLNYIRLDGDIACMVNGAGLAMATMDLIKLAGGKPANFLDVGGGTTADRVAEAFKLIVSDRNVRAILVNIFGGIVRCDLIADGIVQALQEVGVRIPVVVRLEGTNVEAGRARLAESGHDLMIAQDLEEAAHKAVTAARQS